MIPSSTAHFLIRPYSQADEQVVVDLVNQCYRSPEGWTNEVGLISGPRTSAPELRDIYENMPLFVAEHAGRVVGCVKTGLTDSTVVSKLAKPAGYFGLLSVHPDCQSRGLGALLIKHAEAFCREKDADEMVIDVLEVRQDIIRWYNRLGYVTTSEAIDAAGVPLGPDCSLLKPSNFVVLRKPLT